MTDTRTPTSPALTAGIELPYRSFDELREDVEQWAHARGIFEEATQLGQAHKTLEEALELAEAIRKNDHAGMVDGFGDVMVTVVIGCAMAGVSVEDALQYAYNEISGRTGQMVDGVFVKDAT